jgi:threonine/homoserine/homoserine lactone efflux protein
MLYLALSILMISDAGGARPHNSTQGQVPEEVETGVTTGGRKKEATAVASLAGLTIGLTNPYQLGWWIAIGAGMVADFGASVVFGFSVGILSRTVAFSATVSAGAMRYQRVSLLISYVSGSIMIAFGAAFLLLGLSMLLPFPL